MTPLLYFTTGKGKLLLIRESRAAQQPGPVRI